MIIGASHIPRSPIRSYLSSISVTSSIEIIIDKLTRLGCLNYIVIHLNLCYKSLIRLPNSQLHFLGSKLKYFPVFIVKYSF
jgi:hypothetical protein